MKITNRFKNANINPLFTKAAMLSLVAAAALMATPQKASAQVAFGVRIGHARVGVYAPGPAYAYGAPYYAPPVYVAPAPVYGYYGPRPIYDRRFGWDHRDRRYYR